MQAVLEEGNKDDWFSSPFILKLGVIAAVSLTLFIAIELSIEKPLIRLRLLTQRNFGFGTVAMTMVGFALFVSIPLQLDTLPGKPTGADLQAALAKRYAGSKYVSAMPLQNEASKGGRLEPEALNETNMLELYVFASDKYHQAVLVARLDNLGKGASGAAVQNMRLMLGLPEE